MLLSLNIGTRSPDETERPQKRDTSDVSQLFTSYFGFDESFVRSRDFRDEMAVTIMALATKARECAKQRLEQPFSEAVKAEYINAIRDYHHAVELAFTVHPDFENIPIHWSRYPEFFSHWRAGAKPPRHSSTATAEEALLLQTRP